MAILPTVVVVLLIIAWWKIFTKAGEKGWKSLIPIYSQYTSFKIAWKAPVFWAYFIVCLAAGVLNYMLETKSSIPLAIVAILLVAFVVVIQIMFSVKLAKAFGKGGGFAVGLIFLEPIFSLILAFGSAEYVGKEE